MICSRTRIQKGRQYNSYVLVELPSLEERLILPEAEFPPQEITSPVHVSIQTSIVTDGEEPHPFLKVNEAFDRALWVKQRVEGDHFRYSIVLIDLDTADQTVVVPESATPNVPVVRTEGTAATPIMLHRFTADQAGFTYALGLQTYLCGIENRESILLADNRIGMDGAEEDSQMPDHRQPTPATDYAPSGRRILRCSSIWRSPLGDPWKVRLKFSAVEVFEDGKPVRLYTSHRRIRGALWLDNERIVFYEDEAIYLLGSSGGPPRQIFP